MIICASAATKLAMQDIDIQIHFTDIIFTRFGPV